MRQKYTQHKINKYITSSAVDTIYFSITLYYPNINFQSPTFDNFLRLNTP